jgi:hypothetical protein
MVVCETSDARTKDLGHRSGVYFLELVANEKARHDSLGIKFNEDGMVTKVKKGGPDVSGEELWSQFTKIRRTIVNFIAPAWMQSVEKHGENLVPSTGKQREDAEMETLERLRDSEAVDRLKNQKKALQARLKKKESQGKDRSCFSLLIFFGF